MKIEIHNRSKCIAEDYLVNWREIWLDIIQEQPHSFFHSWAWVEHWLKKVPLNVEIILVKITMDDSIAVCMVGHNRVKRHFFINSHSYYLHYTGHKHYDRLTLEYNQILTRNPKPDLLHALLKSLPRNWDELHLPALDTSCFPGNCLEHLTTDHTLLTKHQEPSYFVDLSSFDEEVDGYLKFLSSKTRQGIRQSLRGLSRLGQLHLIPANNLETALDTYNDLVDLHQKSWQERGMPGAFATNWFYDFHKELIENRFVFNEIQLLRIACGEKTLGCLYNFVYQGIVFHYQSGHNYSISRKYSIGLVCQTLAIKYNASQGHKIYDFLAGNSGYKRQLSTHSNQMVWCTIQKPRLRFKFETLAKAAKAGLGNKKIIRV